MLRIGIIGWKKRMELFYHALLHDIKNVEILAVASDQRDVRERVKQDGIKHVFSYPDPLYELHQLDIILIFDKLENRVDQIKRSLASDVHVFVDFPLASNVEDATTISKVIDRHPSLKVFTLFPRRHDKNILSAKRLITDNAIGSIIDIKIDHQFNFHTQDHNKGIFINRAIEDIDTIHYLLDKRITDTFTIGNPHDNINDISSSFAIGYAQDIPYNIALTSDTRRNNTLVKIHGEKGNIQARIGYHTSTLSYTTDGAAHIVEDIEKDEYVPIFKEFMRSIIKTTKHQSIIQDHIAAIRVAVAMTKSYLLQRIEHIDHR